MLEKIRSKMAMGLLNRKSAVTPLMMRVFKDTYSMLSTPGQPVYTDITARKATREGYKMAIPVYRAVRTIIQAASGIPWIVLDKNGEEIEGHPFTKSWANPNPEFSGQDNMEFIIAHLILNGNAYLRPIYTGRIPREFWIEMPDLVSPIPASNRDDWIAGYEYRIGGGKVTLEKDAIIHFKQLDPGSMFVGMGAIQAGGRVIDTYNEALDTQKVSMQNRGMPSGHLFPEEPMSSEQFDEFKRKFREQFLDKTHRREPWLYPRKMQWIEASQTAVEMDYTNSQAQLMRQIAAVIGVDPWWIGDKANSTYNNVQEARKALYEDVALPLLDDVKATLNLKVAPLYGDITIAYDTSNVPALRADMTKKIEQAKSLWAMGLPFEQINNKLELGFEEFPGWDVGYLPFSVAPVGSIEEPVQAAVEEETGQKSLSDSDSEEYKTQEWKRVDSRRQAYWALLTKKFEPLYKEIGTAAANSAKGNIEKNVLLAIDKQSDKWLKTMTAVYFTLIEDFGNQVKAFNPFSAAVRAWVKKNAAKKVVTILDTQKEEMATLIKAGVDADLSNPQIAKSIRKFYTDRASFMAQRVARSETTSASSFGQVTAAKEMGRGRKRWLSSRDDRVRDDHVVMDGETIGINETFSNGCTAPGIGGDASQTIQCRCTLQFLK